MGFVLGAFWLVVTVYAWRAHMAPVSCSTNSPWQHAFHCNIPKNSPAVHASLMECTAITFQKAVITPYEVLNPPLATTGDRGLGEVVSRMVDWPRELCLAQGAVVDPGGACDQ